MHISRLCTCTNVTRWLSETCSQFSLWEIVQSKLPRRCWTSSLNNLTLSTCVSSTSWNTPSNSTSIRHWSKTNTKVSSDSLCFCRKFCGRIFPSVILAYMHVVMCNNELLYRLRRAVITYERHTSALRVSVGDAERQVLRSCRSTLLRPSCRCSGKRRHQRWADVVHSEREVTVSAQSQVSSTVSTVSRCTWQLWTATCTQCHHCSTRFVDKNH